MAPDSIEFGRKEVKILVAAFYSIQPYTVRQLAELKSFLQDHAKEKVIKGLVILSPEGLNTTMSGEEEPLRAFLEELSEKYFRSQPHFKFSWAPNHPFRKFTVKFRSEIVTADFEPARNLLTASKDTGLIPPKKWKELLEKGEEVTVIDTRNDYEVQLGKFRGAINPVIDTFKEFPEFVKKAELPKEKPTLIYCTGGIRCEKAVHELKAQGFKEVYQLEGGILNYLEQFPEDGFEGECFVFDSRVAVDQHLKPSRQYELCWETGLPVRKASEKRQ